MALVLLSYQDLATGQDGEGNDSELISLRSALIKLEGSGKVDFELAGHSYHRPASVMQDAQADDRPGSLIRGPGCSTSFTKKGHTPAPAATASRFEVRWKEETTMLWKPAAVQLRNVRATNVGSFFESAQIFESEAVVQVHSCPTHGNGIWVGPLAPLKG